MIRPVIGFERKESFANISPALFPAKIIVIIIEKKVIILICLQLETDIPE